MNSLSTSLQEVKENPCNDKTIPLFLSLGSVPEDEKKELQKELETHVTSYWKMPDWGNYTREPEVPVLKTMLYVSLLEIFCFHDDRHSCRLHNVIRFVVPCCCFWVWNIVKCSVPKCSSMRGSLTASKTRVSYFSTPKESLMLSQWENNIGLMDGQHLTSKSKVCELHFAEKDIIKGKKVKKDARVSFILHNIGDWMPVLYSCVFVVVH